MKHQTLEQLQGLGAVDPHFPRPPMSRAERLERWAELLDQLAHRNLSTLHQTELQLASVRAIMRADDTPISVAFKDPVLRAAGMENDTYGEAKRFFELSDHQLHRVICFCHFGASVSGAAAARAVRSAIKTNPGWFSRLRSMFAG